MEDQEVKNFNPLWALAFSLLIFNFFPVPFSILLSFVGDWVYQNPVEVEMSLAGKVLLYPIKDNLVMILTAPLIIYFMVWRMRKRGIDLKNELGLFLFHKSVLLRSIFALALLLILEEVYMRVLQVEVPESFLRFMLSEPIILGIITTLIVAPVLEEFIFRGFLFSQLKIRLGNWAAISLSSLAWSLMHFQYEVKILAFLFVFGLFLGFFRWKYNSLFLVIILHAVNNLVGYVYSYYTI